jgi:hypothetical protein
MDGGSNKAIASIRGDDAIEVAKRALLVQQTCINDSCNSLAGLPAREHRERIEERCILSRDFVFVKVSWRRDSMAYRYAVVVR